MISRVVIKFIKLIIWTNSVVKYLDSSCVCVWMFLSIWTDAFRGIFRDRPKNGDITFPMIHVYGFSKAQDPEFDFHEVCSEISCNMHLLFAWLIKQNPGLFVWNISSLILPCNNFNAADKNCIERGGSWCRNAKSTPCCTRKMDDMRIVCPPWDCSICR